MYQSNHHPQMANQSLGNYQRLSGMSTGNVSMAAAHHNVGSPEKRQNKKNQIGNMSKANFNSLRFNNQLYD